MNMINMIIIYVILIIGLLIGFGFALYLIRRKIKKQVEIAENIPQEFINDFLEVERRLKESNGERNPHTILWEFAREKSGENRNVRGTEQAVSSTSVPEQFSRRENIQSISDTSDRQEHRSDRQPSKNRNKSVFSTIFRRKR